ncbi:MAG: hypothetical protein Q4E70_03345 [Candidatus Saccharibacteria bacterium]|nr:hypothetical protein [Candidatus Saccharibacteria bacterium]
MQGILGILKRADKSIRLVDDFITDETLDFLIFAGIKAEVKIYSRNRPMVSNMKNYRRRKAFSRGINIFVTNNFSDRYIIVDDSFLYILSAPLAKITTRGFSYIRIFDYSEVQTILFKMKISERDSPRKIYGNAYECGIRRYQVKI